MNQKKSIKGLANIAQLLNRSDLPTHQAPPNRERRDVNGIYEHTLEKIEAAFVGDRGRLDKPTATLVETYLHAGLRDAYALGHAHALEQGSKVEKLLDKQYEARTRALMPAVVCGVMEQNGLSSMTLDLAMLQTVFNRLDIHYTLDDTTNIIEYTVRPAGSIIEDDIRHQVEDIEQTSGPINVDAEQFEAIEHEELKMRDQ